jgi:hypothetical protein
MESKEGILEDESQCIGGADEISTSDVKGRNAFREETRRLKDQPK